MDLSSLPPRGTRHAPLGAAERAVMAGAVVAGILGWIIGGILVSRRYDALPPDGFGQLNENAEIALIVAAAATAGAAAGLGVAMRRGGTVPALRPRVGLAALVWGLVVSLPLVFVALVGATLMGPAAGGLVCIAAPLAGFRLGLRIARRSAAGELDAMPLRDLPPPSWR